jgi:hypothetical protein
MEPFISRIGEAAASATRISLGSEKGMGGFGSKERMGGDRNEFYYF